MAKKFKILRDHSRGCLAIQSQNHPKEPWCGIPAKDFGSGANFGRGDGFVMGSKTGPRRRSCTTQWLVVICNSTSCQGRLAINMDMAMRGAPPRAPRVPIPHPWKSKERQAARTQQACDLTKEEK